MDRLRWASLIVIALVVTTGATCNRNKEAGEDGAQAASAEPSAPAVEIEGIDTTSLTPREHQLWSAQVSSQLSPCPEVAVPVAQCVEEERSCEACRPAADFLLRMVRAGLPKEEIAKLYEARFDPKEKKTLALGDSPRKGADDPPVTIVEFADFECGGCKDFYPVIEALYAEHGEQMQVVYKHFPLETHPNAQLAAQASWAAQQQDQFWKMHAMLFDNQQRLTEPDLLAYARELGLDLERFKRDMHSQEAKEAVDEDKTQGTSLGIKKTPTIFINGRELPQLPNLVGELGEWVELEIELEGGQTEPSPPAVGPPAVGSPEQTDADDPPTKGDG